MAQARVCLTFIKSINIKCLAALQEPLFFRFWIVNAAPVTLERSIRCKLISVQLRAQVPLQENTTTVAATSLATLQQVLKSGAGLALDVNAVASFPGLPFTKFEPRFIELPPGDPERQTALHRASAADQVIWKQKKGGSTQTDWAHA